MFLYYTCVAYCTKFSTVIIDPGWYYGVNTTIVY